MSKETQDYLQKEVAELQRGFKFTIGALVLITVLLVGYFEWLKGMVSEIVEPKNLSTLAVSEVRRNLPAARIALETNLTGAAPEVVEFVAEPEVRQAP